MNTFKDFETQLYAVNDQSFEDIALSLFHIQSVRNTLYRDYIKNLGLDSSKITDLEDVPFLPISFFKQHPVRTGDWNAETVFTSSGTTGYLTSKHAVKDLTFYLEHAERCFNHAFGKLTDYHFLALLPSYLERNDSSLVAMMAHFIKKSESPYSGFYLDNISQLLQDLDHLKKDRRKPVLWGVSFALLDMAEKYQPDLSHCMVVETGGMKGKRKEIIRPELHKAIQKGLNVTQIYSEYGMTELFSQAYTKGSDRFYMNPWMRVIGRDITDPFEKGILGATSGINVIDLANWHSIAFIETEDLGKVYADGTFEVIGRLDNSDVRGCNLMVE